MPELGPEPYDIMKYADEMPSKSDDVSRMGFHSLSPSDWAMNVCPFGPYCFGDRHDSNGGWGFNFGWFGFHKFNSPIIGGNNESKD